MAGVPGSPSAERPNNEEEVAQDGHHDGDDVERDPAPLVVLVDNVSLVRHNHRHVTGGGVGIVHSDAIRTDDVVHLVTVGVENVGHCRGDSLQVLVQLIKIHLGFSYFVLQNFLSNLK